MYNDKKAGGVLASMARAHDAQLSSRQKPPSKSIVNMYEGKKNVVAATLRDLDDMEDAILD